MRSRDIFRTVVAATYVFSVALRSRAQPTTAPSPAAPAEPSGMVRIFNGKDLTDWDGDPRFWRVENGLLVGETHGEQEKKKDNTFLIWTAGQTTDFDLRLSYRIHGGNSGVQFRSARVPSEEADNKWRVFGYQAEIADIPGKDGMLYHESRLEKRGYPDQNKYLCRVGDIIVIDETGKSNVVGQLGDRNAIGSTYHKGDWNDYVIIARGNHIQEFINGFQTIDLTDNDTKNRLMSGIVALQLHHGPAMKVEFRDIRIKSLEAAQQ